MVERLYNENAYTADFDARVLACTAAGDGFAVVLDRTAFFPEGGGQGGDRGYIGDTDDTSTVERGGGNAQMICGSVAAARSAIEAYFKKE